ncbi:hypothetical protein ABZ672_04255 [Streptomyces mirabilis]|uniref:hypothetical protein n=1 Tax=Streptomyces mirabilis TaxID=68239 RepID=UPI0033D52E79
MSKQEQAEPPSQQQGRKAIRLIFEYSGAEVRLISKQRVDMLIPLTDMIQGHEEEQGFWVEIRDAGGTMLYSQILHDPIQRDVEVFTGDPEQSIIRIPKEHPTGVFAALIPDLEEADYLVLMGIPFEPIGLRAAATELLQLPLGRNEGEAP